MYFFECTDKYVHLAVILIIVVFVVVAVVAVVRLPWFGVVIVYLRFLDDVSFL